jgi:hypothetical protein
MVLSLDVPMSHAYDLISDMEPSKKGEEKLPKKPWKIVNGLRSPCLLFAFFSGGQAIAIVTD